MTKGAHSLTEYTRLQDSQTQLEELRHLGLTNEEIALLLGQEDTWPHLGTGAAPHLRKRSKQEADVGLGADPVAQRQRITAIEHVSHSYVCYARSIYITFAYVTYNLCIAYV